MKAMIINNGSQGNLDEVTATSADVRVGKISVDSEGETFEGEIEDIEEATIGIVDWTGDNTPSTIYPGDAVAADILEGKTAWVNDEVITGTMPSHGKYTLASGVSWDNEKSLVTLHMPLGAYVTPTTDTSEVTGAQARFTNKTVTPTKSLQNIQPDGGKILGEVNVNPIPANYIDTSDANATSENILNGKTAYINNEKVTGTMPAYPPYTNFKGMWWDATNPMTVAVQMGYGFWNKTGETSTNTVVMMNNVGQDKTVTPTKSQQDILADTGKILHGVGVAPIPAEYITTTDANATAAQILEPNTAYVKGTKITGTMTHLSNRSTVKFSSANITPVVVGDNCYWDKNTDNVERAMIRVNPGGYIQGGAVVGIARSEMLTKITNDVNLSNASHLLSGKTAYSNGVKYSGTMANVPATEAAKSIAWSEDHIAYFRMTNGGHLTNASSGYPEVSATGQVKTITPTLSSQTLYADTGKLLHAVTVNSIPNNWYRAITSTQTTTLSLSEINNSATLTIQDTATKSYTKVIVAYVTKPSGASVTKQFITLSALNNFIDYFTVFGAGANASSYNRIKVQASYNGTAVTLTFTLTAKNWSYASTTCGLDVMFVRS